VNKRRHLNINFYSFFPRFILKRGEKSAFNLDMQKQTTNNTREEIAGNEGKVLSTSLIFHIISREISFVHTSALQAS
jgi:hypothetical protein